MNTIYNSYFVLQHSNINAVLDSANNVVSEFYCSCFSMVVSSRNVRCGGSRSLEVRGFSVSHPTRAIKAKAEG